MISYKVVAPNEGGDALDYRSGIWRVYFENADCSSKSFAFSRITLMKMNLPFGNWTHIRNGLTDWANNYLKDRSKTDIK